MILTKLFNCSRKGLYRRPHFKPQLWSWSLLLYYYVRSYIILSNSLDSLDYTYCIFGKERQIEYLFFTPLNI